MYTEWLLAPRHQTVLAQWACASTLFAFDFDGTLAPIVDDPNQASMSEDGWRGLSELAKVAPVAIISGRSTRDLSSLVPPQVRYLIGNHGSEGVPNGDAQYAEKARTCASWYHSLMADMDWLDDIPGTYIESKGVSLSLHYRQCSNQVMARAKLLARAAALKPAPKIIRGNCVINVLPYPVVTKKDALHAIMAESKSERAVFIGDDQTDELVFQDAPEQWLTIRVGDFIYTEAQYFLHSVDEVQNVIEQWAHVIAESKPTVSDQGRSSGLNIERHADQVSS